MTTKVQMQRMNFRHTLEQHRSFGRTSGDLSPIHTDPTFALSTPYGQTISYGGAAVILMISLWLTLRNAQVFGFKATFHKPIFLNRDYELTVEDGPGHTQLTVTFEDVVHVRLLLRTDKPNNPRHSNSLSKGMELACSFRNVNYKWDENDYLELKNVFNLNAPSFPTEHIQTICWLSYFVGMVFPEKRGVLVGFEAIFSDASSLPLFPLESVTGHLNQAFHLASIDALGPRFRLLNITAAVFKKNKANASALNSISL